MREKTIRIDYGFICPFCKRKFSTHATKHIYTCNLKPKGLINKDEIKKTLIQHNYPILPTEEVLRDDYIINELSIIDLVEKYKIRYFHVLFLLKFYKISLRKLKVATNTKYKKEKVKKTNLLRYGHKNVSSSEIIKERKRKTSIRNYGVDNIRKLPGYTMKKLEEKYNMSFPEFNSIRMKKVWENLSKKEKQVWIERSLHSDKAKENWRNCIIKGYVVSSLEKKFKKILEELYITYTIQFQIKIRSNKRYFYDFFLPDLNLIIEINGEYWHADPEKYKGEDVFKRGNLITITAQEIWDRDFEKERVAREKYNYVVFWERELKDKNLNKLKEYIFLKIKNNDNRKIEVS